MDCVDEYAYCKVFLGGLHYDTRDGTTFSCPHPSATPPSHASSPSYSFSPRLFMPSLSHLYFIPSSPSYTVPLPFFLPFLFPCSSFLHTTVRSFIADLRAYCERFGAVISAEVMFNRETHKSRGFGFIVFEKEKSADLICSQHEIIIDGKLVLYFSPRNDMLCIDFSLKLTFELGGGEASSATIEANVLFLSFFSRDSL